MQTLRTIALLVFALGGPGAAMAAPAGKILLVSGTVSRERGDLHPLKRGDALEAGDIVVTGDKSRAQILMADGARIALRAGTRFRIDEFSMPGTVSDPGASAPDAHGMSVASLLKGGFHTSTGAIGRNGQGHYEVRTPLGKLGVRGTDYTVVYCTGDCSDVPQQSEDASVRDGLYVQVTSGAVGFAGGERAVEVNAGDVVFVPLSGAPVETLAQAPAFLERDAAGPLVVGTGRPPPETQLASADVQALEDRRVPQGARPPEELAKEDGAIERTIAATASSGESVDLTGGETPVVRERRDVSFSVLALGQSGAGAVVAENPPDAYALDAQGNLTAFTGPLPGDPPAEAARIDLGTSALVESDADAATGMRWGRWSGGEVQVTGLSSGQTFTQSLAEQSLHWVVSANGASPPVMPTTGSADYTLVGGTSPTDAAGNVGTLGAASFTADFTNQIVSSTLDLTVDGLNWVMSGTGTMGAGLGLPAHQFSGSYDQGVLNPVQGTPTGTFSGFFVGPGGTLPGIPGGAALTYALQEATLGLAVNGVAVFRSP